MNYGYSTPYQGATGGLLPAGSMQAATEPGRNIARGLEQFGEGIGAMIAQYQKNKAEKEFASGELEGLISQFVPRDAGPPTGESGGPDVSFLSKMVGEKNVKKFVDGKATTADMLAMTHSIKTAQNQKEKEMAAQIQGMNLQILQGQLKNQQSAAAQPEIIRNAIKAVQDMPTETTTTIQPPPIVTPSGAQRSEMSPMFQLPGQESRPLDSMLKGSYPEISTPQPPVTTTTQIPPEVQKQNLLKMLLDSQASPETLSLADSIMSLSGKTMPAKVAGGSIPGGATWASVDGKVQIFPPIKADTDLSAEQSKALSFARGMKFNSENVEAVLAKGYSPKGLFEFSMLPERWKSTNRKDYEAASRAWIENFLRDRSGAVISKDEYPEADKQYFPQKGDKPDTLEMKRNMRQSAMEFVLGKAGAATHHYVGEKDAKAGSGIPLWSPVKRIFE